MARKLTAAEVKKSINGFRYASVTMKEWNSWRGEETGNIITYTGWVKKQSFPDSSKPEGFNFFIHYVPKGKRTPTILTTAQRFISMEEVAL